MKNILLKILWIAVLVAGTVSVRAQEKPRQSSGDLYQGLTKKVTYNQMISPYGLEVSYYKTVHVIFPSPVVYVDLGSNDILAGKAEGAENVLRVKSAVESFTRETNFAVITADGRFYTFNVKYAKEPEKLNVEMKDFLHESPKENIPDNRQDIFLKELGSESPARVEEMMQAIYDENKQCLNHIGSKQSGITFVLKSIYVQNDILYFHTEIKNNSHLNFDIDFIRFKIVDKKAAKRTAIQETILSPLRAHHNFPVVEGRQAVRSVYALQKFTIADKKVLVVELFEKNGSRHQKLTIENTDLIHAKTINQLKAK